MVNRIWKVLVGAEKFALEMFPKLKDPRYPSPPEELIFLHAEEILDMYPDLPRKQRETAVLQKYPAIFIGGIGWPLKDGYPHEMRAADYDDWVTDTSKETGSATHGLNGDILVWNPVTKRRHELTRWASGSRKRRSGSSSSFRNNSTSCNCPITGRFWTTGFRSRSAATSVSPAP